MADFQSKISFSFSASQMAAAALRSSKADHKTLLTASLTKMSLGMGIGTGTGTKGAPML